jgi:tetratricopeptide (TPR) repeat protein
VMARFVFRTALLSIALVVACPASHASATGPDDGVTFEDIFAEGNALYETADFDGAIQRYTRLVDEGVRNKDLFYNLGNAYYKVGQLGRAVLFYERARRAAPRDRDVRENLSLLRSQLRDKQFVQEQNRVVEAVMWLHRNLNTREMISLASGFYLLLCLLGIVFVVRDSAPVAKAYRRISLVSPGRLAGLSKPQDLMAAIVVVAFLFVSTGVSAYGKWTREQRRDAAVVLDAEVAVYSGPTEDTTLQFKVHEGTMVRIEDERRDWMRIELPGGLSGWVNVSAVERI